MFLPLSQLCDCKRNSVGVHASVDTLKPTHDTSHLKSEEPEFFDQFATIDGLEEALLSKIFSNLSDLKLAYIQLQQAHIPYDPKKLSLADQVISSEIESLSELEQLFSDKKMIKLKSKSSLLKEIQEQQSLLEELQSKVATKDTEILRLKWELEELELKNAELEEEHRRKENSFEWVFSSNRELTPGLFSQVFDLAYKSIHDFGKPLISLMKASGWDLHLAANSIAKLVSYSENSHKKYAFEAYISRAMLSGSRDDYFELDQFGRVMHYQDPFDALIEGPTSSFARFCRLKYLIAVPSKMESSFFGHLDQRRFVLEGGHPRTPFYQAFARMARFVWALQVVACNLNPKAEIFSAKRGQEYSEELMDSVVDPLMVMEDERFEVGLTVMPGFRIGNDILRCRVYLCSVKAMQ